MSEPTQHEQAVAQDAELRATHRDLAVRHAEVEERAGHVHDDVARVHEQMGQHSRLDPAEVRRHAQAGRDRAALERERAEQDDRAPDA